MTDKRDTGGLDLNKLKDVDSEDPAARAARAGAARPRARGGPRAERWTA